MPWENGRAGPSSIGCDPDTSPWSRSPVFFPGRPAVSQHLNVRKHAGLVTDRAAVTERPGQVASNHVRRRGERHAAADQSVAVTRRGYCIRARGSQIVRVPGFEARPLRGGTTAGPLP
jgi:hypothetical protein